LDYHSAQALVFCPFQLLTIIPAVSGILIFIAILLLLISFLMAGSEIAFFSLTQKDVNVLKTRQQPSFRRIVSLLEQPKTLHTSMFITIIFVNIGFILIANILIDEAFSNYNILVWYKFFIKVLVVSFIVILFSQVLPRIWATHNKLWFASAASLIVEIFNSIFYLLSKRFVRYSDTLEKQFSSDKNNNNLGAADLDNAIDSLPDNEASIEEKQILKGIRKFGDTPVKQIMRTRLDVHGIEHGMAFIDLIKMVEDLHYSRLPVYKNNLDEIVGMLHTKDLLPHIQEAANYDWHSLVRTPIFVHEQKWIEDLLQEFRTKRVHFAIVVDEFGGTAGIVTLEDIMEEIIGEIKDEFDDEESINKKIDDNTFIFEGKLMINDACKAMNLNIDYFDDWRGESDSMAGLILEIAGKFPQVDEEVIRDNFTFIPLEINKNRIDKIKVIIKQ
jgi:putative hemolysin